MPFKRNKPIKDKMKSVKNPAPIWADEWKEMEQTKSRPLWSAGQSLGQRPLYKIVNPTMTNKMINKNFFFIAYCI